MIAVNVLTLLLSVDADMVFQAILALKERSGSSAYAIKKFLSSNWKLSADHMNTQVRLCLRREVEKGTLVQVKASYKLSQDKKKALTKPKKAAKKKTAAKVALVCLSSTGGNVR